MIEKLMRRRYALRVKREARRFGTCPANGEHGAVVIIDPGSGAPMRCGECGGVLKASPGDDQGVG